MALQNSLDMLAFTYTPNASGTPPAVNALAVLKAFGMGADNEQKDAGGLADRFELMMNVKQEQMMDFTVFIARTGGTEPVLTNLDITVFSLGGAYIGTIRGGTIEVTTVNKEGSGIAQFVKFPAATRTKVQVTAKKLVSGDVTFMSTMLGSTVASMDVAVTITWGSGIGGGSFTMPMTMKADKHGIDREELQMEDVTLTGKGTATGPNDNSLLGNILLGTAQVSLAVDTGAGQYNTASMAWALITKLTTKFEDADCIEQTGQFAFQGAATYVAD